MLVPGGSGSALLPAPDAAHFPTAGLRGATCAKAHPNPGTGCSRERGCEVLCPCVR